MAVLAEEFALRQQLLDDELMVVVREVQCLQDLLVFVKLRLGVNQREVRDSRKVMRLVLLKERKLSLQHLLDVKVVEKDLGLWQPLTQRLVQLQVPFDDKSLWLHVVHPLCELCQDALEVSRLLLFNECEGHNARSSIARHCEE